MNGRPPGRAAGLDPRTKLAVQADAGLFVVAVPWTALAVVACAAARADYPAGDDSARASRTTLRKLSNSRLASQARS